MYDGRACACAHVNADMEFEAAKFQRPSHERRVRVVVTGDMVALA